MKKGHRYPELRRYDRDILDDLRLFGCATVWQLITAHFPEPETGYYVLGKMRKEGLIEMALLEPELGTVSRRVVTIPGSGIVPDWARLQLYELFFQARKLGWHFVPTRPFPLLRKGDEADLPVVVALTHETAEQVLAKAVAAGAQKVAMADANIERANEVISLCQAKGIHLVFSPHFMARKHPRRFRQAPL